MMFEPKIKLLSIVFSILFCTASQASCQPGLAQDDKQNLPPGDAKDYTDYLGAKVDYWHPEKMPLKVLIVDDPKVPNYRPQFKDFFISACQTWSNATQGKLRFKFVQAEPYDIKVSWTNDKTQLHSQGELGEAGWKNDQDGLFEATIKLLTVETDANQAISDKQAKLMCLHELGHALGLVKHSPYLGDIMNASIGFNYNTPIDQLDLSERDKKTIFLLYSNPDLIIDKLTATTSDPRAKLMRLCFKSDKLIRDEKYDEAYAVLEQALAIDPHCVEALSNMSDCCFEQGMDCYANGDNAKAISRLEKFLAIFGQLKLADGSSLNSSPQVTEAKEAIAKCKAKLQSPK
jgi:hypothetical protein